MKSFRVFFLHEKTEEAIIQLLTTYDRVFSHPELSRQFTFWSQGIILDTSEVGLARDSQIDDLLLRLNLTYFHQKGSMTDKICALKEIVESATSQDGEITHVEVSTDQDIFLAGQGTDDTSDIAGFTGYSWQPTSIPDYVMLSATEETGIIQKTDIETVCAGLNLRFPPHNPNLFWGCKSKSFALIQLGMFVEISRICEAHSIATNKILEIFNGMLCLFATTGDSSEGGITLRLDYSSASTHSHTDGRPKLLTFQESKEALVQNNVLDSCLEVVSKYLMYLMKGLSIDSSFFDLPDQTLLFDAIIKNYRTLLGYDLFKNRYLLNFSTKETAGGNNARFGSINDVVVPCFDREFLRSNQANIAPWNLKTLQLSQVKGLLAEIPVGYWEKTPSGLRDTARE